MTKKASDFDGVGVIGSSQSDHHIQLFDNVSPTSRAVPCHQALFRKLRCLRDRLAACLREDPAASEDYRSHRTSSYMQPEHSASFDDFDVSCHHSQLKYGGSHSKIEPTKINDEKRLSRLSLGYSPPYERCHSEPPPYTDSLEDASHGYAANQSANRHATPFSFPAASRGSVNVWKDLPDTPIRYRLGEGLPWSSGLPEPDVDPDDERLRLNTQSQTADRLSMNGLDNHLITRSFSNPTIIPILVEDSEAERQRDIDVQRKRKLENLSTAMMTVEYSLDSEREDFRPQ